MQHTETIDFANVESVAYNGQEVTKILSSINNAIPSVIWTSSKEEIISFDITYRKDMLFDEFVTETISFPKGYTWEDLATNQDDRFIDHSGHVVFALNDQTTYWIASDDEEMIEFTSEIKEGTHYFVVWRTKEFGDNVETTFIKVGSNHINVDTECTICYFKVPADGTYKFSALYENSYIGYETIIQNETDAYEEINYVVEKEFTLEAKKDDLLYILCSTYDFNVDEYDLEVSLI